jgi:hypothetical protein
MPEPFFVGIEWCDLVGDLRGELIYRVWLDTHFSPAFVIIVILGR